MKPDAWVLLVLVSAAVGCRDAGSLPSTTRDSVGVAIIDNFAPAGPFFDLDSVPAVDIGPGQGSEGEFVGPVYAVRLGDGRIAANGWATTQFRIFDSTGRWLKTVGRAGAGPGEFEGLGMLFRGAGDSLLTFEPQSRRVQRWTSDGQVVDLKPLLSPQGQLGAWVWGAAEDGTLLLWTRRPDEAASTALVSASTVTLFRAATTDGAWDSLISFPGQVRLRHPKNPRFDYRNPLFAPAPSFHQRQGRIAFASGDRFEVELRAPDGRLTTLVRRSVEPRRVSADELDRAVRKQVETVDSALRSLMESRFRQTSTDRIRPPVAAVWLAGDGRLWVISGDPDIGERVTASVFDSAGRWLTDVTIPTGLEITQIDGDGLLGVMSDDDDFRHIRLYRFVPRSAPD